jgi:hypothetical protein
MLALQKYKKRFANFMDLSFNCVTEERYIYVKNKMNENFKSETPFLKILKPFHIHKNKNYVILSINADFDFNDEINDFIYLINKIHEFSQENIKLESKKWFGKDFDIYDLDNIVKRPIEEHKSNNYIKLIIPNIEELEERVLKLEKDTYVKCNIEFQGLKISREILMEEWVLTNFITQKEFDETNSMEYIDNLNKDDTVNLNKINEYYADEKELLDNVDFDNTPKTTNIEENNDNTDVIEQIIEENNSLDNICTENNTYEINTIETIDNIENTDKENTTNTEKTTNTTNTTKTEECDSKENNQEQLDNKKNIEYIEENIKESMKENIFEDVNNIVKKTKNTIIKKNKDTDKKKDKDKDKKKDKKESINESQEDIEVISLADSKKNDTKKKKKNLIGRKKVYTIERI